MSLSGLSEGHWTMAIGVFKERVTKAVYQQALLNGPYFVRGELCDVVGKSLGAGIYEVWMKRKNT